MKKSNKEILEEVMKSFGTNEICFLDKSKKGQRHPYEAVYSDAKELILSAMDKARKDEKNMTKNKNNLK